LKLDNSIRIQPYSRQLKKDWDSVLSKASYTTFLYTREFIEYHGDRFTDASLIIYDNYEAIAVFPAECQTEVVYSHRGLTYGGWVFVKNLEMNTVEAVYKYSLHHYSKLGFQKLIVRMIPDFFADFSLDSFKSILEKIGAKISFTGIHHFTTLPFKIKDRGKRWGLQKALHSGLRVVEDEEMTGFWENILIPNLSVKHQAKPTHSIEDIMLLKNKFPKEVLFFSVYHGDTLLGGAVVFDKKSSAHLQYVAASKEGKQKRALDYLMSYMIQNRFSDKKVFSMGVSHNPNTKELNQTLISWKESFGGKPCLVNTYEFDLAARFKT
jgi:hypothetical protein